VTGTMAKPSAAHIGECPASSRPARRRQRPAGQVYTPTPIGVIRAPPGMPTMPVVGAAPPRPTCLDHLRVGAVDPPPKRAPEGESRPQLAAVKCAPPTTEQLELISTTSQATRKMAPDLLFLAVKGHSRPSG
jgi:hypothetical protein